MKSLRSTSMFLVFGMLQACGAAEGPSDTYGEEDSEQVAGTASFDPLTERELEAILAQATPMEILAEVESQGQTIQFVAAHGLAEGGVEVGLLTQTDLGATDRVSELLKDGATPLEVYNTLAPAGSEAPEVLVENHPIAAEREGREPEVRNYSDLPTVAWNIQLAQSTCASFSNFLDFAEARMIDSSIVSDSDDDIHNVNTTATSSSSRDVNVYMCNFSSNSSCNRDRKRGIVYAASSQGAGAVLDVSVSDCRVLSFNWTSRNSGTTYGITARDGCIPGLVNGNEICTPASTISHIAVGWDQ